jgi:hypothetical protein
MDQSHYEAARRLLKVTVNLRGGKTMAMSKKHYEKIAKAINSVLRSDTSARVERVVVGKIAIALADVLNEDNPNFDRRRFYNACVKED